MPANREIYHFDDFTLEGYGELLGMALGVNDFVDYPNAKDFDRFVIWRHDVDMSPAAAVETALIENSLGIRAHYFFLPHSEFYNLLERENLERVWRIGDLGHSVQLHFDSGYYGVDSEERLERCLRLEADFFNEVLGVRIGAFSFHNPSAPCSSWLPFDQSSSNSFRRLQSRFGCRKRLRVPQDLGNLPACVCQILPNFGHLLRSHRAHGQ
ncbi:MAG: hypothetical protein JPMHGGIA_02716 [Saprospiraceae bacterium]|nr:hypothetical protein [Saprospiraceae bacterium]